MDKNSRLIRAARMHCSFLLSTLPSMLSGALLAAIVGLLALPTQAEAAKVLIGSGANVAITGVLVGGGGGGGSAPALAPPANVRVTSRVLCTGSPVPTHCSSSDGSSSARIAWYDISTDDVRTHLERRLEPGGA